MRMTLIYPKQCSLGQNNPKFVPLQLPLTNNQIQEGTKIQHKICKNWDFQAKRMDYTTILMLQFTR